MAALLIAQSWPLRSVVLFFQAAHRIHLSSATEATQGCAECKRARGRRRGDGGASRGRGYGHTEIRCNHHETENKDHAPCRQARRDPSGPLVRWHRGRPAHTHTMRDSHKNNPNTTKPPPCVRARLNCATDLGPIRTISTLQAWGARRPGRALGSHLPRGASHGLLTRDTQTRNQSRAPHEQRCKQSGASNTWHRHRHDTEH